MSLTARSLKDWIKIYEEKTKDKADLPYGFRLFYLAERGFASMKPDIEGKMMVVYQTCGDAKFWRDFAELQANAMGLDVICTVCTRHIRPYIRGFGWEILTEEERAEGEFRFFCQDSSGRKVIITHKGVDNNTGEPVYWVSHYIHEKATSDPEYALRGNGDKIKICEEGKDNVGNKYRTA